MKRKRKTFEQLLTAALEAHFACGDWRDDPSEYPPYEVLHRRALRTRAAVVRAHQARRK